MKTLLVAATQAELAPLFSHFNLADGNFIENKHFDVLITGVGMVATAFALGRHLNQRYQLVLNLGIAGSFDRSLALGTIVAVKTDIFAELGAESEQGFIPINELGFGENEFGATHAIDLDLPEVKSVTVNCVTGKADSIQKLEAQFNPNIESMEGAAVFFACHQLRVPCLQVRSISNYVAPRNKSNWQIDLAIQNLNQWAISFLEDMN